MFVIFSTVIFVLLNASLLNCSQSITPNPLSLETNQAQLEKAQQTITDAENAIANSTQSLREYVGKQKETAQAVKKALETAQEIKANLNQLTW